MRPAAPVHRQERDGHGGAVPQVPHGQGQHGAAAQRACSAGTRQAVSPHTCRPTAPAGATTARPQAQAQQAPHAHNNGAASCKSPRIRGPSPGPGPPTQRVENEGEARPHERLSRGCGPLGGGEGQRGQHLQERGAGSGPVLTRMGLRLPPPGTAGTAA
jgi:hypothetical protein